MNNISKKIIIGTKEQAKMGFAIRAIWLKQHSEALSKTFLKTKDLILKLD
jgi:hypothetical protein